MYKFVIKFVLKESFIYCGKMSESTETIRTRNFMSECLLARKQMEVDAKEPGQPFVKSQES